jgi:hypothetical protein
MTPVFQRIICENRGDCLSCCIASILDLPYEQVPPWLAVAYDATASNTRHLISLPGCPVGSLWHLHHWDAYKTAWLRERGWHLLTVPDTLMTDFRALVGAYCIASMPSQALPGHSHAVVGQWVKVADQHHRLEIVHDPNPNNKPYPLDVDPLAVMFLVPLNPAKITL